MANPITVYPKPKKFRALSYQEVRDRVKSFESSACSEIWVFDGLLNGGRCLIDFGLNKVFTILSDKCGENYLFIERIQ